MHGKWLNLGVKLITLKEEMLILQHGGCFLTIPSISAAVRVLVGLKLKF